jgi:hypothetical protein
MVIGIGFSVKNLVATNNGNPTGPFADINSKAKLWKETRALLFEMRR